MIVGSSRHGVVLACCYVARLYGVRSAMPMFKALMACPDANLDKPRGFAVLTRSEAALFLADKPVSTLWGLVLLCTGD